MSAFFSQWYLIAITVAPSYLFYVTIFREEITCKMFPRLFFHYRENLHEPLGTLIFVFFWPRITLVWTILRDSFYAHDIERLNVVLVFSVRISDVDLR